MNLFDSHSHYNDEKFDIDREEIIKETLVNGVSNFIVAGYNVQSSKKAVEIAGDYDGLYAIVGISPNDLENLKDKEDKSAHYACSIVLVCPDGRIYSAEDYMQGEITENRAGNNGFGYDPIFFLPEFGKTAAEISPEEKNAISHRGKALRKLLEILKKSKFDM